LESGAESESGILRAEVFNTFVQNTVEKSRSIVVSDSPQRRFNTLHWSEGWHFRGRTRE
jgi:hypothetical protein